MSDDLTDIPNLLKFRVEAEELLKKNIDKSYAIIVFDVDNFNTINDLYGYDEGDGVLRYIGDILKSNISEHNLYCRMYADNFGILMEYEQEADYALLAITLAEEIAKYRLEYEVMLSFGVCKVEKRDITITVLCERASLAKKLVKGNASQLIAFYDETMGDIGIEDKNIENEMAIALENGGFAMYLQPKMSIPTTEVVGAEALIHWVHPIEGLLSPNRFIPLLKKNEFSMKLDYYVWEKAFATIRKWMDEGYRPVPISVNVSRLHIHNANLVEIFVKLAEKYKVPKNLIEIELMETAFLDNLEGISNTVRALKKEGFILSMENFSLDYSCMNILKDIPVDVIKIAKGFVGEAEQGKESIRYTVDLARQLNIDVIAEGVENFVQAEFLFETGCETAQGSFYSMPLSIKKFEQYTYGLYNE